MDGRTSPHDGEHSLSPSRTRAAKGLPQSHVMMIIACGRGEAAAQGPPPLSSSSLVSPPHTSPSVCPVTTREVQVEVEVEVEVNRNVAAKLG